MLAVFKFPYENCSYSTLRTDDCSYKIHDISKKALHNDQVTFIQDPQTKEVHIIDIVKRCQTPILGVLNTGSNVVFFKTNNRNKKLTCKTFISFMRNNPNFIVPTKIPLQSTDTYVVITPVDWKHNDMYPIGSLLRILGNVGDYKAEQECLKVKNNVWWRDYKYIKDINLGDYTVDTTTNREDLTNLQTVSIDPPFCKDIDDCLHIIKLSETLVEVGVHIADVSSYITPDTALDQQIQYRGQSVYLTNEQLNMLPDELATDVCSLLEGKKRRTFTVLLTVDCTTWDIVQTQFKRSYITNKKAMSYDEAETILKKKNNTQLKYNLQQLYQTGQHLYLKQVSKRTTLQEGETYDTHKMVEIFMVLANVAVATKLKNKMSNNALLRVCSGNKLPLIKTNQHNQEAVNQVNIFKMNRAEYTLGGGGEHTPLGESVYTHFTSPIRRYADILVHRQLASVLNADTLSYKVDQSIIDSLNQSSYHAKAAERESHTLELIYKLYHNNNSIDETEAYVVSIADNKMTLYVPLYKVSIDTEVFSYKLKQITQYVNTDNSLTITTEDDTTVYNLLDCILIRIVVTIKTPYANRKLQVEILDNMIFDR